MTGARAGVLAAAADARAAAGDTMRRDDSTGAMAVEDRIFAAANTFAHGLRRVVLDDVPRRFVWLYITIMSFLYVVVIVHTPLTLYPSAPHDDGAFMLLGRYLSEGSWLGPYGQYTLMKGPGYPAFLALGNWLGIPVSLAHASFHCFAIALFTLVCHRFVKSAFLSALMFTLLVWQPNPLSTNLERILREQIYYGQLFLVLSLMIIALFSVHETRQRLFYGALAGLALGWFWLTREEGYWIAPVLALLAGVALLRTYRYRHHMRVIAALSMMLAVFIVMQAGFRAANWWHYGKFVGVDFKEANFQKALGALHSVRSGGIRPFVPVSRATRQYIYRVSPAFASLKYYFDPPNEATPTAKTPGWTGFTCSLVPEICGEIAAGWFMWGLRDAASQQGHYASPRQASAFFATLAYEINTACARGELECKPQLVAELPPVIWSDVWGRLLVSMRRAFDLVTTTRPPVHLGESTGTEGQLAVALRFLNYPLYTLPRTTLNLASYRINGWYYSAGHEWLSVAGKMPSGVLSSTQVQRNGSPDIQAMLKDPEAGNQRFTIQLGCVDECMMVFEGQNGARLEKPISELLGGVKVFKFAGSSIAVESVDKQINPVTTSTLIERISNRVRIAIVTHYHVVFLPVLAVGFVAFLAATLLYWRQAAFNVVYVLALASWMLTFLRAFVLALVDATSFPALQAGYLTPAYFTAVSAAVLSCAALLQLRAYASRSPPAPARSGIDRATTG